MENASTTEDTFLHVPVSVHYDHVVNEVNLFYSNNENDHPAAVS